MTVKDAQRHTTKLQLRLPPDVAREIRALSAASGVQVSTLVALAWAVARRSGGLAAALATVARAAGREGYPSAASPNHARRAASSPRNTLRSQSTGMPSTR